MTTSRKNATNTRGKPFEPGNPGKPRGARHKTTLAIEALLEGEHEALTRKAIEMALAGDGPALRLCLDRLAPPRRDAPISITLAPVKTLNDVVQASAGLLASLSAGEITPDEAGRVMALLAAHRQSLETSDFEKRLAVLEARKN